LQAKQDGGLNISFALLDHFGNLLPVELGH